MKLVKPKETVIKIERVSKWYKQVIALNDVSIDIKSGITGLLGPNGAGKSTLLKIITGHIKNRIGTATLKGQKVWNNPEIWKIMGYCPELDAFWADMTGFEFTHTLAKLHGFYGPEAVERAKSAIKVVDLTKEAERNISGYSKGMRQRLKFAQALLHDPEILILDEPLGGMDPLGRASTIKLLRKLEKQGKTILVSSHVLNEIERLTDEIILIHRGRLLAEGRINEIRDMIDKHPHNIFIETTARDRLAARLVTEDFVFAISKNEVPFGVYIQTRDPNRFYSEISRILISENIEIQSMGSQDDNLDAVFRYLVG